MNAWQSFWSKFGFYKKELAAVDQYEAKMDAWNKVKFNNKVAQTDLASNFMLTNTYLGEIAEHDPELIEEIQRDHPETKGDPTNLSTQNGFKAIRSSFYSLVSCVLATEKDGDKLKYSNEDLYDLGNVEMQKARAKAARTVYEKYQKGDTDRSIDLQLEAS